MESRSPFLILSDVEQHAYLPDDHLVLVASIRAVGSFLYSARRTTGITDLPCKGHDSGGSPNSGRAELSTINK